VCLLRGTEWTLYIIMVNVGCGLSCVLLRTVLCSLVSVSLHVKNKLTKSDNCFVHTYILRVMKDVSRAVDLLQRRHIVCHLLRGLDDATVCTFCVPPD
jgi:hypothetical protein